MRYVLLCFIFLGCVTPQRTYHTEIHCEGDSNAVTIRIEVSAPQDYRQRGEATIPADVSLLPK